MSLQRPLKGEFSAYYESYIQDLPEGEILAYLQSQLNEFGGQLKHLSEEKANFRYAEGKWSIKEVLGHISDTERIMSYRLLRIARGDNTPLAGFNESDYVAYAGSERFNLSDLLAEFSIVRTATLDLANRLDDEAWQRTGIANGAQVSARAIIYIIAGHAAHHLKLIRERYLQL
ncbi:DinB family protein [Paenibacillus sp. YPG26]|uniref:DinB family protein n=1 Tax=Paenibacillus sp. YPG26 TaxID=2878915 RepID=UPI00203F6B8F|nr:DinB family protein [Paenibacillus sp. YPG26]USB34549.1 DinB family protein [Paenibacillus sp. YPG26]